MTAKQETKRTHRERWPVSRIWLGIGAILFLIVSFTGIWNLDVVFRLSQKYQGGSLSEEKISFDIASFDLGLPTKVNTIIARRNPRDGMMQVFVPASGFLMGESDHPKSNHYPQHKVYLDAYWIDQIAVTNRMYAACMQAGGCTQPAIAFNPYYGKWAYRDYPATYVTWWQAQAYCQWAGRRLPTEAEFEKAGRGTDGRTYPWGDRIPDARLANFGGLIGEAVPSYRYPSGASPYGALNMSGNVREWVWDWFDPNYYEQSPYANPKGPDTGAERSLRGGSYNEDAREIAIYRRYNHDPLSPGLSRGFRCAEDGGPNG